MTVKVLIEPGNTITTTLLEDGGAVAEIKGTIIDPGPEPTDSLRLIQDYGAVGDGQADDTNAIQRACDDSASTRKPVVPGTRANSSKPVFMVRRRGTCSMAGRTSRYCIAVKSGTRIDGLKACEFKLGDGEDALMFTNADQNGGNSNIRFKGFELNGNRHEQSARPQGSAQENGGIGMDNVRDSSFVDIHAWNVKVYGGNWLRAVGCVFTKLLCEHSDADGWNFGLGGFECRSCTFEDIWAEDTAQNYTKMNGQPLQGNPVKLVVIDSVATGRLGGNDVTGGVKPQGMTRNLTLNLVDFDGGPRSTANSGLKNQGDQQAADPSRWVNGIRTKTLRAVNCAAEGLRMSHASECVVDDAYLENCGEDASGREQPSMVFREVCRDCGVGKMTIRNGKGVGVEIRKPDVQRVWTKELYIDGVTGNAIRNGSNGTYTVDYAEMRNVQRHHASASGPVIIKHLKADKPLSTSGNVTVERFERF